MESHNGGMKSYNDIGMKSNNGGMKSHNNMGGNQIMAPKRTIEFYSLLITVYFNWDIQK